MAKFMSKCENLVLCVKPNRSQIVDGIVVQVPGEHIRFDNGVYETAEKKEIDFIKKHRLYGSQIAEVTE